MKTFWWSNADLEQKNYHNFFQDHHWTTKMFSFISQSLSQESQLFDVGITTPLRKSVGRHSVPLQGVLLTNFLFWHRLSLFLIGGLW